MLFQFNLKLIQFSRSEIISDPFRRRMGSSPIDTAKRKR